MNKNDGIPQNAQLVFEGKIFDVYQREQQMFDGSKKTFEKLKRNDSVDVIAILENGEIIVLEEEQPGRDLFYGLVGGTCEDSEEPIITAKRELLEETGLVSNERELFGSYGRSSKIAYKSNIFIARNCEQTQQQNIDKDGEKINIKKLQWNEFVYMVANPKFRVSEFALVVLRNIYFNKESELKNHITHGQ